MQLLSLHISKKLLKKYYKNIKLFNNYYTSSKCALSGYKSCFSILYDPHNDSSASQNMYFIFLFFLYVLVPHDIIFLIIFLYVNIYPILFLSGFPTHHPPFLRNIYSSAHELFIIISLCFFFKKKVFYIYIVFIHVYFYKGSTNTTNSDAHEVCINTSKKHIHIYIYVYIYIFFKKPYVYLFRSIVIVLNDKVEHIANAHRVQYG